MWLIRPQCHKAFLFNTCRVIGPKPSPHPGGARGCPDCGHAQSRSQSPCYVPLSSGGAANKDLWDRVIHLSRAVSLEVQESWRPLVDTWS